MAVTFDGFPRVVERDALRPGRWFVAAAGVRPLICFSTEEGDQDERVILTFGTTRPETVDFAVTRLKDLVGPLATLEYELVFSPGAAGEAPQVIAPIRRAFRPGALLRLKSGDLGLGYGGAGVGLTVVSLATGQRAEGYDLVFDRWSLFVRRGAGELYLIGRFRPI
jgi:hypothetical protein